jgi:nuclear pore complex protein Nup93
LYLFQRNLDQLEALSKKLKAKTLRAEAPSQSIAATRYLYDSCCRFSHVLLFEFTILLPRKDYNDIFYYLYCCIYRLLAREGINAEQLARDLKSFELKVKYYLHST